MIKKDKIISSFVINIIEDEKPSNLHILSEKDISQLLKRIEKTKIKTTFFIGLLSILIIE